MAFGSCCLFFMADVKTNYQLVNNYLSRKCGNNFTKILLKKIRGFNKLGEFQQLGFGKNGIHTNSLNKIDFLLFDFLNLFNIIFIRERYIFRFYGFFI